MINDAQYRVGLGHLEALSKLYKKPTHQRQ